MSAGRWIFAAAVLVSCAVPELDRTGAIRCGPQDDSGLGLCPSGFECRLERCCPTGGSASTCPAIPAASTGSPCTAPMCTGTSTGACCATVNNRGERVLPGGYTTTLNCTSDSQCGEFGVCLNNALFGRPVCLRRCTYRAGHVTPCRDAASEVSAAPAGSYVCIPDPEGRSPNDGVCIPDCTMVPQVCGSDRCDPGTHTCANCIGNPSMCGAGTACNRSTGRCQPCGQDVSNTCGTAQVCAASGDCVRCGLLMNPCLAGYRCNVTTGRCAN